MIKGLDAQQITDRVAELGKFSNVVCIDISSYDAAQSGKIWEIEREQFRVVFPETHHVWYALVHNEMLLRSKDKTVGMLTKKCMASGEKTTSSTNTSLNMYITQFALRKLGVKNYDFVVEGDDNIIGFEGDRQATVQGLLHIFNSLGFACTLDHSGTMEGAEFCKIMFTQSRQGNWVGYKNPSHSLAKVGFTKHKVKHPKSPKAVQLMRAKLHSLKATYHKSQAM